MKILIKFSILFLNDKNKGSAIPYLAHVQHLLCNSKNSKKKLSFLFYCNVYYFYFLHKISNILTKISPDKNCCTLVFPST